jgi:hypothetical protein
VRVVELQLLDEDAEHVAQVGELQARRQLLELAVQVGALLRAFGLGQAPDRRRVHCRQGSMTAAPAALNGPVSRLATARPLAAAMAAM